MATDEHHHGCSYDRETDTDLLISRLLDLEQVLVEVMRHTQDRRARTELELLLIEPRTKPPARTHPRTYPPARIRTCRRTSYRQATTVNTRLQMSAIAAEQRL